MTKVPDNKPIDIERRNVCFSYDKAISKPVLQDISIVIPAGSFVAIVGESGSGKTTLMKLLLKFYQPDSGEISLGGRNLLEYSASSLRKTVGVVMQDNFLFSDSIRNNITLGSDKDSEESDSRHDINQTLMGAIDTACLSDYVKFRPMGVNTMIGAEGIGLSGGERQRVMLARVAYKNPPYIMLDEATSSLDAEIEKIITNNLAKDYSGATRIVIAHRMSTVKDADLIIVMHQGRIVEKGTHDELIKTNGYYKNLVSNQLQIAN